jgi:hypothetical protein
MSKLRTAQLRPDPVRVELMPDGNLRIYGLTFGPFEPFTTTPGQFEAFCKWLESEAGWKLRQMLSAGKSQQVSTRELNLLTNAMHSRVASRAKRNQVLL